MEILNRKAHFNYFILEEIESGIGIEKCNSGIVIGVPKRDVPKVRYNRSTNPIYRSSSISFSGTQIRNVIK